MTCRSRGKARTIALVDRPRHPQDQGAGDVRSRVQGATVQGRAIKGGLPFFNGG